MVVRTRGVTHVQIAVADVERSMAFYKAVLGARELFRTDDGSVFLNTPGTNDTLTIANEPGSAGKEGGVVHFGFRLLDTADADAAAREIEAAGGRVLRRGEHGPGSPFVYARDPDGYIIEFWYEPE
jgi:catechol 2,3-dioxygenase-like lactoylglutathione lyase family enzyme